MADALLAEPDVDHRVQLDLVRRRAGHAVLLIEEAEPFDVDLLVQVVPAAKADPVSARDIVPGRRDAGLPQRRRTDAALPGNLGDHGLAGGTTQPQMQIAVVFELDRHERRVVDLPGAELRPPDPVILGIGPEGAWPRQAVQVIDARIPGPPGYLVAGGIRTGLHRPAPGAAGR